MSFSTLILVFWACSSDPKPDDNSGIDTGAASGDADTDTSDTDTSDTDTSDTEPDTSDTDTDTDTDTDADTDSIDEGRTGNAVCAAGGHVQGSTVSGSFCLGAVDISPSTQSTSASFQWQPGPTTAVSP